MGIFVLFPFLWALFWLAVVGGGGYLLLRAVRALELRSGGGSSGALVERVRTLEDALLRMERQVDELAEAQRFTTRLLSERTGAGPDAPGTTNASGASGAPNALPPAARPDDVVP